MKQLFRFLNQILLLLVFILSIKDGDAAINYKLTAIYYGNQGWQMDQVANLTLWTGKRQTVIVLFTEWCGSSMNSLFYTQLRHIWNSSSIPVITWQLFGCGDISQPGIVKLVNNKTYDAYINQFSDRLKQWLAGPDGIYGNGDDRRAYLRLGMKSKGKEEFFVINNV
jgi:hypothetical protein